MRFSSMAMPGSGVLSEPVAIRIWRVFTCCWPPSFSATSTRPGAAMRALPLIQSILCFLKRKATPAVLAVDHPILLRHHGRQIELDARNLDAVAGKAVAGLMEALRGEEQRLGGDAADIEAGAAQGLALLDAGRLQPELGRADRRDIAARSAADHHQIIALGLAHRFSACCFLALRLPGGARRTSTTARSRSPP